MHYVLLMLLLLRLQLLQAWFPAASSFFVGAFSSSNGWLHEASSPRTQGRRIKSRSAGSDEGILNDRGRHPPFLRDHGGSRKKRARVVNRTEQSRRRHEERPSSQNDRLFNPKNLTSQQIPNDDALSLNLFHVTNQQDPSFIKRKIEKNVNSGVVLDDNDECKGSKVENSHLEYLSLDDLFPNMNFGNQFFTNGKFRNDIRNAMRRDIFFTTPAYANLSPKVASMMLDDDSSLQGSWNCIPKNVPKDMMASIPQRMMRLTKVLQDTLGSEAPTGDEFMMKLGQLCGVNPSNHWIDIIGIKDRKISHSWHQDTGVSFDKSDNIGTSKYTVMLGFPLEDEYTGCGVFSHVIKLDYQHLAPDGHNVNEPILFEGTVDDSFIVRPIFTLGKEIIRYGDVDVLHSAPDVTYRQSVMRFM
mmetsp:Transcript_8517/g.16044  ORF Transcript_8517/g.16044 Transcript_8517/m.16044 type:complete len:414 (+) Transcript_8517:101-1342(+)